MTRSTLALGVVLLSLCGCSSSETKSGGGGGTGSGNGTCPPFTDLCTKLPVQVFAAACGVPTTSAVSTDHEPTSASDPAQVSTCEYDKGGTAQRLCFHDGPAAAQLFYDTEHEPSAGSATTQQDLTGVGDKAFFRETISINEATVYAVKGQILIDVSDTAEPTAGAAKDCLISLAKQLLSL